MKYVLIIYAYTVFVVKHCDKGYETQVISELQV